MVDINVNRIFKRFMPHFLRKSVMLDYLAGAAKALRDVNDRLVALREAILLKLSYTGQTIYLEQFLNDNFDPVLRRIYITNTNIQDFIYWHNVIENQPKSFLFNESEVSAPVYLNQIAEFNLSIHFIVNVPVSLIFDPITFDAGIRLYAQAGKVWEVVTF